MNCFAIDAVNYEITDAVNYEIIDVVNEVSWILILGSCV